MIRSILAVTAAATLLLTGCSRDITGTAVIASGAAISSDEHQCANVAAPLADIPLMNASEPRLRIPVPQGWKRNTRMDSKIIRYAIVAEGLIADGFAPNAVVTLESVRGSKNADDVFEENRSNLVAMMGAFDLTTETNTTCGFPSETTDYTAPAMGPAPERPITMHAMVVDTGRTTYLATLTIQTADEENPAYQRDARKIINGFQLVMPHR